MSREREKQPKKPIAEGVSAIAALAQAFDASQGQKESSGDFNYQLESSYLDHQRQQLAFDHELHAYTQEVDKHVLRKWVLGGLFLLTCFWLLVVVVFVGWTAMSATTTEREKLIQLQTEVQVNLQNGTNLLAASMLKAASPKYCSIPFRLSDSVLIAFITSTKIFKRAVDRFHRRGFFQIDHQVHD